MFTLPDVSYNSLQDISLVVVVSKELEAILNKYYGAAIHSRKPFGEKLRRSSLNKSLKSAIYTNIILQRNLLVHEINCNKLKDREGYVEICELIFKLISDDVNRNLNTVEADGSDLYKPQRAEHSLQFGTDFEKLSELCLSYQRNDRQLSSFIERYPLVQIEDEVEVDGLEQLRELSDKLVEADPSLQRMLSQNPFDNMTM